MGRIYLLMLSCLFLITGSSEGAFEAREYGARVAGMSGAAVAIAGDAFSFAYNPAHLASINKKAVGTSYHDLFGLGLEQTSYTLTLPFSFINFGLLDSKVGDDVYNERLTIISFGKDVSSLSVGGSIKYYKVESDITGFGYGFDLGLIKEWPRLTLGIAFDDIINTVSYNSDRSGEIESKAKLGLSFRWDEKTTISMETVNGQRGSLALERWYSDNVAVRLGLSQGYLTGGLTLIRSNWQVDYAYTPHQLGSTHRLTTYFLFL